MFVYKALADGDGKFAGIRARLTLRGDQQAATRYRKEATAPVYSHTTLRLLLTKHTCNTSVRLIQGDVGGAYLTAFMRSKVTARLPAKYRGASVDSNGELIMPKRSYYHTLIDVFKALYGGDDSGRCFYDEWVAFHKQLGFESIVYDRCYLRMTKGSSFIEMLWHVDDTLYFVNDDVLWTWYTDQIAAKYEMEFREVEDGQVFTGFRICRYPHLGHTTIDQQVSVEKTLRAFGFDEAKGRANPIVDGKRPTKFDAPQTQEEISHASRVPYHTSNILIANM